MFYRLIATRTENAYVEPQSKKKVITWHASNVPITRFEALDLSTVESYGREIYQREGIIAEIFEMDGR